jgi:hypothetical protein
MEKCDKCGIPCSDLFVIEGFDVALCDSCEPMGTTLAMLYEDAVANKDNALRTVDKVRDAVEQYFEIFS